MKKILLTLQLIALTISAIAQTDTFYIKPYTEDFDSIHAPLLEDSIPYGRLYDRVFPWAGLDMAPPMIPFPLLLLNRVGMSWN